MKTGDVIENPAIGQRLVLCVSPEETGGRSLVVEYSYKPHTGNKGHLSHVHRTYKEHFEILAGTGRYQLDGQEKTAQAGDSFDVPLNTVHLHPWNDSAEELRIRQTTEALQPDLAGFNATLIAAETIAGLAQEGKIGTNGQPNLFQGAVILHSLMPQSYTAGIPYGVQRVLIGVLATVGRLLGYRASYSHFKNYLAT
jgi:quercetin dioxygenase-like cupin family protein